MTTYTQATESVALQKEYITDLTVPGVGHGGRDPIWRINTQEHRTGDGKCREQSIKD